MNRWTSSVLAYFGILAAALIVISITDHYFALDRSARDLLAILVGCGTMIALLVATGIVIPRLERRRASADSPTHVPSARSQGTIPAPAQSRRWQWIVVALGSGFVVAIWIGALRVVTLIPGSHAEAMMLFQLPFVSAIVSTIAILALRPATPSMDGFRRLIVWLPIAVLLAFAVAGIFVLPYVILLQARHVVDQQLYAANILPGFFVLPSAAVAIWLFRSLRSHAKV